MLRNSERIEIKYFRDNVQDNIEVEVKRKAKMGGLNKCGCLRYTRNACPVFIEADVLKQARNINICINKANVL